jgi:hypothetical protein
VRSPILLFSPTTTLLTSPRIAAPYQTLYDDDDEEVEDCEKRIYFSKSSAGVLCTFISTYLDPLPIVTSPMIEAEGATKTTPGAI